MVGLAGSTNMTSCTCLALSALAHEFRGIFIFDLIIGKLVKLIIFNNIKKIFLDL